MLSSGGKINRLSVREATFAEILIDNRSANEGHFLPALSQKLLYKGDNVVIQDV